ncbi:CocE/NonD family hydrolase [Streptomyces sp. NPDC059618]|uniref:CocE/NonD family hydrolase n=1 Tax=Streptomyces sp. NPDC059618 TaxID=3346887 RepID=UPI0036B4D33B
MHIRTSFPYETTHEDVLVPLPDGTRLYARIWRPLTEEPVPALLEYLPYRLTDGTAPRDRQRHPWYAGHGYASVRVDARGHGNSEGVPGGAYPGADPDDAVEVVSWLAAQPWCTGRVGMFGIAWGGLLSLRVAARAPGPLKAVVTVCSADGLHDPYENDAHRVGGSVSAVGTYARSAARLAFAARPPDPAHVGEGMWRDMWERRLEAVLPSTHTRPAHRTEDAHAPGPGPGPGPGHQDSVDEEYGAVRAAVLAVGGWHDPHRDAVLRLVRKLPADRVRGLIGPWSRQYPDRDLPPGPAIGFLQETLRWWDHWLKEEDTGALSVPLLRSYVMDAHPPATVYPRIAGRWVGDPVWPSPSVTPVAYALQGAPLPVRSPQHTGVDAGRLVPFGDDADLPPDQREEDARSACFEFEVPEETWVLGRPRVSLRLTSTVPGGQVIARLCDVAPDGASTLVTRGALNLSARRGPGRTAPWSPGTTENVVLDLNAIGYAFPAGHRIRLGVSSAYWPWIWPEPGSEAGFTLEPIGSVLELPVRARESDPSITFAEPEESEPLGVTVSATLDEPRPQRLVVRDVAAGTWSLEVTPGPGGTRVHPDGLACTEEGLETYTIESSDPLSARTRSTWSIRLHRPDLPWEARVETVSVVSCDARDFITSDELVCKDGDEVVFHRTWEKRIPRTSA